jgi:hypothetical protein
MSVSGIRRRTGEDTPRWSDSWFYGVFPCLLYLALAVVASGFGVVSLGPRKG